MLARAKIKIKNSAIYNTSEIVVAQDHDEIPWFSVFEKDLIKAEPLSGSEPFRIFNSLLVTVVKLLDINNRN